MNTYGEIFDRALRENPGSLSSAGMSRRRRMGRVLESAVVTRRRRRRVARAGAALTLALAVLAMLVPMKSPLSLDPRPDSPRYENLALEIVRDQPGIMARFVVEPAVVPAETWIDDAELIDLLRAADRPSGVLRIRGRFILTDPFVTEEPPD